MHEGRKLAGRVGCGFWGFCACQFQASADETGYLFIFLTHSLPQIEFALRITKPILTASLNVHFLGPCPHPLALALDQHFSRLDGTRNEISQRKCKIRMSYLRTYARIRSSMRYPRKVSRCYSTSSPSHPPIPSQDSRVTHSLNLHICYIYTEDESVC